MIYLHIYIYNEARGVGSPERRGVVTRTGAREGSPNATPNNNNNNMLFIMMIVIIIIMIVMIIGTWSLRRPASSGAPCRGHRMPHRVLRMARGGGGGGGVVIVI